MPKKKKKTGGKKAAAPVAAPAAAAPAPEPAEQLQRLTVKELRQRCTSTGVDPKQMELARESDDPKSALISLIQQQQAPGAVAAPAPAKAAEAAQAAKGLDKVTDGFAKGQEVKADKATMDAAASKLKAQDPAKAAAEKAQRERAARLAKVKLNPEDVDFYVNNCCCAKDQAEKALRQTEGDLKAALLAFAQA